MHDVTTLRKRAVTTFAARMRTLDYRADDCNARLRSTRTHDIPQSFLGSLADAIARNNARKPPQ